MLQQAKFTYYPLWKTFEKQVKAIEKQRRKQTGFALFKPKQQSKLVENLFPKYFLNTEVKVEIDKIKMI